MGLVENLEVPGVGDVSNVIIAASRFDEGGG